MGSAVIIVVLVSLVHTTRSWCTTTTTCSESSREERPVDNVVYLKTIAEGVTELLLEVEKTQKNMKVLEDTFNSRLSAIESQLASGDCSDAAVTFLRRQDGSVNFTRSWSEYRDGFGDPAGEFWLGLTSLHSLTTQHRYGLRVDLLDWSGERKLAEYGRITVGSESEKFKLSISGYNVSSTAGDSMTGSHSLNGMAFSTYDRDNDVFDGNCAANYKGGWWYRNCHVANPTGLYKPAGYIGTQGINWSSAYNDRRSFKAISFKLVPV